MATTGRAGGFGPSTAHYNVVRMLGEGGFGKVWECVDVHKGGRWAVKESKEVSGVTVCASCVFELRRKCGMPILIVGRNIASAFFGLYSDKNSTTTSSLP